MQNYLAVAISGSAINIFDISTSYHQENKSDQSSFYRTIATLNAHTEKVVCLSWSPHISGYLVSGSYDNTARVCFFGFQDYLQMHDCLTQITLFILL